MPEQAQWKILPNQQRRFIPMTMSAEQWISTIVIWSLNGLVFLYYRWQAVKKHRVAAVKSSGSLNMGTPVMARLDRDSGPTAAHRQNPDAFAAMPPLREPVPPCGLRNGSGALDR